MIFKKNILVGLLSFWIFGFVFVYAQPKNIDYSKKSFKELKEIFKTAIDSNSIKQVAEICLKRAKTSKKIDELITGYTMMAYAHDDDLKGITYADSTWVYIKKQSNNHEKIISHFHLKGYIYIMNKEYEKAINNFIIMGNLAKKHNSKLSQLLSAQLIGTIKADYLGDYEGAKKIFKYSEQIIQKIKIDDKNYNYYISNLHNLSNLYNSTYKLDSASYYCDLGYKASIKFKDSLYKNYFTVIKGIVKIRQKQYHVGIDSILKGLPAIIIYEDYGNILGSYHEIGVAYQGLKQEEFAVKYFRKVDSLDVKYKCINPEFISGYKYLIAYYKKMGNITKQLYYMDRIIAIDERFKKEYKTINHKIKNNYDIPTIVSYKEEIISRLRTKTRIDFWLKFGLGALALGLGIYAWGQYRSQQRFKKIIASYQNPLPFSEKVSTPTEPIIPTISLKTTKLSEKIIAELAQKLARFEKDAVFLSKDISQNSLAEQLGTNQKYLSQFINEEKNKSFNQYINDLRITYILEKLTNEKKYRNYSLDALADESGFKSAETFSSAFYKFTNLKPGYFIKQLQKTA